MNAEHETLVRRYVESIQWIREILLSMDKYAKPIMGVGDWDDSVCIKFGTKKLLLSADGPYTKRLVLKSALLHASTDVIVKGGRPLFALDTVIGSREDIEEMILSLRCQAEEMRIPLLGGNTLFEDTKPRCSLTVAGELILKKPIRDCGAKKGDVIALLGEPLWGSQDERLEKARTLFNTWYSALGNVKINSAKDVTKGGLVSAVYEMEQKSERRFQLEDKLPYSLTRNLDNFILTLPQKEYAKLEKTSAKNKCALHKIGAVK